MKDTQLAKNIIKVLCEVCGLKTQTELADFLEITQPAISKAISVGQIPQQWIDKVRQKYRLRPQDIAKRAYALMEETSLSEIDYPESSLPENRPPGLLAGEQTDGYKTPREQFKKIIAARFEPIFEWLADDLEGSSARLEVYMEKYMERFKIENPDYRLWLHEKGEKKPDCDDSQDVAQRKNCA